MRQFLAILLLVCFGMMLPTAALSVRVCTSEQTIYIVGSSEDNNCCSDGCHEEDPDSHSDPCCLELEKLPDTLLPQPTIELPPFVAAALPTSAFLAPAVNELGSQEFAPSDQIRGPTSPAAYRAVLGIWRL